MKILFLIDSLGSGGAQRQLSTLACILKEKGHDVQVVCYYEDNYFAPIITYHQISIKYIVTKNIIKRLFSIRKFILNGHFNVVISFTDTPDFINNFSAIGKKKWKIVTSERSAKEEFFDTWRSKLYAVFRKHSDVIVCNSHNARQLWIKNYPRYRDKLEVIYNAVDISIPTITYNTRENNKTHFIIAASFLYLKNPLNVINAISQLDGLQDLMTLDWYGKYGYDQSYEDAIELIKINNLSNCIKIHPPTLDISEKMHLADCVCLFSYYEGLPNAICEAMALSKPIIMTKVSDYDILVDRSNGILCEANSISSIKDAFKEIILTDKKTLINMGIESKRKADSLFSQEKTIARWETIISNE